MSGSNWSSVCCALCSNGLIRRSNWRFIRHDAVYSALTCIYTILQFLLLLPLLRLPLVSVQKKSGGEQKERNKDGKKVIKQAGRKDIKWETERNRQSFVTKSPSDDFIEIINCSQRCRVQFYSNCYFNNQSNGGVTWYLVGVLSQCQRWLWRVTPQKRLFFFFFFFLLFLFLFDPFFVFLRPEIAAGSISMMTISKVCGPCRCVWYTFDTQAAFPIATMKILPFHQFESS